MRALVAQVIHPQLRRPDGVCVFVRLSPLGHMQLLACVPCPHNYIDLLQEVVLSIHSIWGAPIYILAIMALLYREIEWASLVGLGVLLVLVPISGFIGRGLGKQRRAIVKFIDRRTSFMSEIINGIRVIKFYNWERPFKCALVASCPVHDHQAPCAAHAHVSELQPALYEHTLVAGLRRP